MAITLWFSNLAFWSIQSVLLVAAAGFLPYLFRIRQPRVLLGYWRTVLAIALLLPLVQPWSHPHIAGFGAIAMAPDIADPNPTPLSASTVTQWLFFSPQIIARIFGALIFAGIAVRLVILGLGLLKLRQFRQAALPISASSESTAVFEAMRNQVNARAEFRLSAHVDVPVTFGFAAPVILLPERVMSMNARFQAAIACHELVHVRRHDWAHHLAEEIIRAALWFHPAIVWLISRVRLAREQVVDLEVINLTKARKTYLEALLEFASGRSGATAVPAPPFLGERQLAERVALMSKEIRMSRTRLIASLATIACCLMLVAALAARTFPLKGAPQVSRTAPAGAVNRTDNVVPVGSAAFHQDTHVQPPSVDIAHIWIDTVKKGPMVRRVRGLGTLVRGEDPANLFARVILPEVQATGVKLNQKAEIDTHKGLVKGHVSYISPSPANGTRSVDIALDATLPEGAGANLQVDGVIEIEKLADVVYVGRPVHGSENASMFLFKIVNDGKEAVRVNVKLGRSSAQAVEVLDGLSVGDKVILSDTSNWDNVDRIHIMGR